MNDKTTPKDRNEYEILGYRYALNLVHESFEYIPIRSNFILQIHKEMYQFMGVIFGVKYRFHRTEIILMKNNTTSGIGDDVLFNAGDTFDMGTFKSQFIKDNKLDNGEKLG